MLCTIQIAGWAIIFEVTGGAASSANAREAAHANATAHKRLRSAIGKRQVLAVQIAIAIPEHRLAGDKRNSCALDEDGLRSAQIQRIAVPDNDIGVFSNLERAVSVGDAPDGSRVALPSGALAAYTNFAYD